MPELATKANQLLERLKDLRHKPSVDDFTLRRLQQDANSLLKVDAFHAYQILGMLEIFTGNAEKIRLNYEKALNLCFSDGDKAMALNNYAVSMELIGYLSEAVRLGMESYQIEPTPSKAWQNTHRMMGAGLFHRAAQLIDKDSNFDSTYNYIIRSVKQFMDEHDVSDDELQRLIEIAISVLRAHNFFNYRGANVEDGKPEMDFVEDENSRWFCYMIRVNRSVEEVVEMDYELACQLAESDLPLNLLSNFLVTYRCVEDEDGID